MIQNFEELKKQLNELATVLNSFKSEAVQLKLVDIIFEQSFDTDDYEKNKKTSEPKKILAKRKLKKVKVSDGDENSKSRKSSKMGPGTILNELIEEGFFDKSKTINKITEHSESSKGKKIKSGDFSSVLVRFVRDKRLERTKNSEGQYEYTKK